MPSSPPSPPIPSQESDEASSPHCSILSASVFLVPKTWAEAAPGDATMATVDGARGRGYAGLEAKENGNWVSPGTYKEGCDRAGARSLLLPFGRGNRAVNRCALASFRPSSEQSGGVIPPLQPLGFLLPPQPRAGSRCHQSPPAPGVGGCSGRQADPQPLPGSLPCARDREHVPRTKQWEFGVFIYNPALTPGLGGE